jgi:uncharacterized protein (UPF0332 family)
MKKQANLTDEERRMIVEYRIQRAKETLLEADSLINSGFYNAAVNRLYYACFYAVVALLVSNGIVAKSHNGARQMFLLHFISNGKIDKKHSVIYSRLFNDRMSGDYDDFVQFDEAMLSVVRPQAEELITDITNYLNNN